MLHCSLVVRCACAVAVAVLFGGVRSAQAIIPTTSTPDSQYTDFGNQTQFASVGEIQFDGFNGSGVLISSDWVLTAAHVVTDVDPQTTFNLGLHNSGFDLMFTDASLDIGLLHLTSSINDITPAVLNDTLTSLVGQVVTHVGFGATSVSGDDIGTKRAANSVIISSASDLFTTQPQTGNALAGSAGPGDSGGATFVNIGGQATLLGVNSSIISVSPPVAGVVPVASARSFIDSHVSNAQWTSTPVVTPPTATTDGSVVVSLSIDGALSSASFTHDLADSVAFPLVGSIPSLIDPGTYLIVTPDSGDPSHELWQTGAYDFSAFGGSAGSIDPNALIQFSLTVDRTDGIFRAPVDGIGRMLLVYSNGDIDAGPYPIPFQLIGDQLVFSPFTLASLNPTGGAANLAGFAIDFDMVESTPTPEPASAALLTISAVMLHLRRNRSNRSAQL